MDELAKKANISKGAFYKFFASKEYLYFVLLDDAQKKYKKDILDTVNQNVNIDTMLTSQKVQ